MIDTVFYLHLSLYATLLGMSDNLKEKTTTFSEITLEVDNEIQQGLSVTSPASLKKPLIIYIHGHNFSGGWSGISSPLRLKIFSGEYNFLFPTQIGYGRSGQPDFCGPKTVDLIHCLVEKLKIEKGELFDWGRVYLVGVSRGATVATLLAEKYPDVYKKVVVLGGVYDMNKDYNWPTKDPLIKQNMDKEIVPLTTAELEKRSPILFTKLLQAPILILHGQKDKTVSSQQAIDLATELEKNSKEYKLVLVENADHGVGNPQIFKEYIWPFLSELRIN